MKLRYLSLCSLIALSLNAENPFTNLDSFARAKSPEAEAIKTYLAERDFEQSVQVYQDLEKAVQKKSFLHYWTLSEKDKAKKVEFLLEAVSQEKQTPVETYFLARVLRRKDVKTLIEHCKKSPILAQNLTLLSSFNHSAIFKYLYQNKSSYKDKKAFEQALINTASLEDTGTVISELKRNSSWAYKAASKLLQDRSILEREQLIKELKLLKKKEVVLFSSQEKEALKNLYTELSKKRSVDILEKFFSQGFSKDLNRAIRQEIDLEDERLLELYYAKELGFNLKLFRKYRQQILPLNSAKIEERLQTLLKLRDKKDYELLPVFVSLLKDPRIEVRVDALYAVSSALENKDEKELLKEISHFETQLIELGDEAHPELQTALLDFMVEFNWQNEYFLNKSLKSENTDVRNLAIQALSSSKDEKSSQERVLALLKDPSWQVRSRAVDALKSIETQKIVEDLSNLYFAEDDEYVKNNLLPYISRSKSPRLYKSFKTELAKASEDKKLEWHKKILQLNLATNEDFLAAKKSALSLKDEKFSLDWLKAAKRFNVDVQKEFKALAPKLSSAGLSSLIDLAIKLNFDFYKSVKPEKLKEWSPYYALRYLSKFKGYDEAQKLAFLKLFIDSNYEHVLSFMIELDEDLSDGQLAISSKGKESLRAEVKSLSLLGKPEIFVQKIFVKDYKNDLSLISDFEKNYLQKEKDKWNSSLGFLLKKLSAETFKKEHRKISDLLLKHKISTWTYRNILSNFPKESVMRLYQSVDAVSQEDLFEYVGQYFDVSEIKKIKDSHPDWSDYTFHEVLSNKVKLLKEEELLEFITLVESLDEMSSWERDELGRAFPHKWKSKIHKLYRDKKLKLSPFVYSLIKGKLDSKDINVVLAILKTIEEDYEVSQFIEDSYNLITQYLMKNDPDYELLVQLNKLQSYSKQFPKAIAQRLFKNVDKAEPKLKEQTFAFAEKAGIRGIKYHQVYLSLLKAKQVEALFEVEFVPSEKKTKSIASSLLSAFTGGVQEQAVPAKLKQEIKEKLLEYYKNPDFADSEYLSYRLVEFVSLDEFFEIFKEKLVDDSELLSYLPQGQLEYKHFKLIESLDLEPNSYYSLHTLEKRWGVQVIERIKKDYLKSPSSLAFYIFSNHLKAKDYELVKKQAVIELSSMGDGERWQRLISNQSYSILNWLTMNPTFKSKLSKEMVTVEASAFYKVLFFATMNLKIDDKILFKALDEQGNRADQALVVQLAYMSGSCSKKLLNWHSDILKDSKLSKQVLKHFVLIAPDENIPLNNLMQFSSVKNRFHYRAYAFKPQMNKKNFTAEIEDLNQLKADAAQRTGDFNLIQKYVKVKSVADYIEKLKKTDAEVQLNKALDEQLSAATVPEVKGIIKVLAQRSLVLTDSVFFENKLKDEQERALKHAVINSESQELKKYFAAVYLSELKTKEEVSKVIEIFMDSFPSFLLHKDLKEKEVPKVLEDELIRLTLEGEGKAMNVLNAFYYIKISQEGIRQLNKSLATVSNELLDVLVPIIFKNAEIIPKETLLSIETLLEQGGENLGFIPFLSARVWLKALPYGKSLKVEDEESFKRIRENLVNLYKEQKVMSLALYFEDEKVIEEELNKLLEKKTFDHGFIFLLDRVHPDKRGTYLKKIVKVLEETKQNYFLNGILEYCKSRDLKDIEWIEEKVKRPVGAISAESGETVEVEDVFEDDF